MLKRKHPTMYKMQPAIKADIGVTPCHVTAVVKGAARVLAKRKHT